MPSKESFTTRIAIDVLVGLVVSGVLTVLEQGLLIVVTVGAVVAIGLFVGGIPRGGNFAVEPKAGPSYNEYRRIDDFGDPGGDEKYKIWVTFDFRSDYPIEIRNIDMSYSTPSTIPGSKEVYVDDEQRPVDGNYELRERIRLDARESVEIFVKQEYICPYASSAHGGEVTLEFALNSPAWRRFKHLEITGDLRRIGRFEITAKRVRDGILQEAVSRIERTGIDAAGAARGRLQPLRNSD